MQNGNLLSINACPSVRPLIGSMSESIISSELNFFHAFPILDTLSKYVPYEVEFKICYRKKYQCIDVYSTSLVCGTVNSVGRLFPVPVPPRLSIVILAMAQNECDQKPLLFCQAP